MSRYIRSYTQGATYFFTLVSYQRRKIFTNYSQCWSQIKRRTTKLCPQYHLPIEELSYSKVRRNEKGIFQRRFYEHLIKDASDFRKHIDYLHYNPIKHGLVTHVRDWQYSSFHRYAKKGLITNFGCF